MGDKHLLESDLHSAVWVNAVKDWQVWVKNLSSTSSKEIYHKEPLNVPDPSHEPETPSVIGGQFWVGNEKLLMPDSSIIALCDSAHAHTQKRTHKRKKGKEKKKRETWLIYKSVVIQILNDKAALTCNAQSWQPR